MVRSFDVVLIAVMTAAAVVTYSIKHRAEDKLAEVRRLEAEIRLEKDTIDLLKADWALLTQPNRLQRLVEVYAAELQLEPTAPTQLAMPAEMPMHRSALPQTEIADAAGGSGSTIESIIASVGANPGSAPQSPMSAIPIPIPRGGVGLDAISTGSVNH